MSRKYKFHYNPTRIKGTLHVNTCIFMIIPHSTFLRMRDVSDKIYGENQNTFYV